MGLASYSTSAPGSLFLLGEHAVLQDKCALVVAINKRMRATLRPREDNQIMIHSVLGSLEMEVAEVGEVVDPNFSFVLAVIQFFQKKLKGGFELSIQTDFSHQIGFGSSAAVAVCVFAVLDRWLEQRVETDVLLQAYYLEEVRRIIRQVQGVGSGADVAASVYGGLVAYQQRDPSVLEQIKIILPLVVVYSGFKKPTTEVVHLVEEKRKKHPEIFASLFEASDAGVQQALRAVAARDWSLLGDIMNIQQGILSALGVSLPILNELVDSLNADNSIYGAKISGSGLGDCVVGLGESRLSEQPNGMSIAVALDGLCYE